MRKERGSVKKFYPQIREMHEKGICAKEIGIALNLEKQSINNAIAIMGLAKKRVKPEETNLIYADNRPPVLEKVIVNGKLYTDVAPLFIPH